jgi:hypothetical protein
MKTLPALGILVLMLLVVSGYVSSSPNEETEAFRAASPGHLDPHLGYYEEHLIRMGIERRKP